jgi:hypothetical protein
MAAPFDVKYVSSYGEPSNPDFVIPNVIMIQKVTTKRNNVKNTSDTTAGKHEPKRQIDPMAFKTFLFSLPKEAIDLADITEVVSNYCTSNTQHCNLGDFYEYHDVLNYEFQKHYTSEDVDIGNIEIKLRHDEFDAPPLPRTDTIAMEMTAVIYGVLHHNDKYYALTRKLSEWLKVPENTASDPGLRELRKHVFY